MINKSVIKMCWKENKKEAGEKEGWTEKKGMLYGNVSNNLHKHLQNIPTHSHFICPSNKHKHIKYNMKVVDTAEDGGLFVVNCFRDRYSWQSEIRIDHALKFYLCLVSQVNQTRKVTLLKQQQ